MKDYDKTHVAILKHLYKHGYIGKRHTPFENALKGIPKHMKGEAKDSLEYSDMVSEVKRIIGAHSPV